MFFMIEVVLGVSLAVIMFSLGLGLSPKDFAVAIQQPKALFAGVICQVVLLPLLAFVLVLSFRLEGEFALGVMILSCCPGGITSNVMTKWGRGDVALSISYTSLASLLTAITLPLILSVAARSFLPEALFDVEILPLSVKVFSIATLPVLFGVTLRRMQPLLVKRSEQKMAVVANALFVVILLGTLIGQWNTFTGNLLILGPILLGLNLIMLFLGCCVGSVLRLPKAKITTLAIESGFQNGTVGIVVGALVSQPATGEVFAPTSLPSAVYGVLMLITIAPFILWRRSCS